MHVTVVVARPDLRCPYVLLGWVHYYVLWAALIQVWGEIHTNIQVMGSIDTLRCMVSSYQVVDYYTVYSIHDIL